MSAKDLQCTVVHRCGKTAKTLNFETRKVRLETLASKPPSGSSDGEASAIRLFFTIDSKGGGKTELYVDIHEGDFVNVISAMVEASPTGALPTMASAVAKQLAEQPKHDARLRELARSALVAKAKASLNSAPHDDNDVERLVYKNVVKLANELRDVESKQQAEADSEEEE